MSLRVVHNSVPAIWIEDLQIIEKRVTGNEQDAMKARWEFGRMLVARRRGKLMPRGVIDEVVVQLGMSRSEVRMRIAFADRYHEEKQLANALASYPTWFEMVRDGLFEKKEPKPRPSVALVALRTFAKHAAELRAEELSDDDWPLLDVAAAEIERLREERE